MVIDQVEGAEPPVEDPGATARTLMRASIQATLATSQRETGAGIGGWPSPSLVLVGFDLDATPLLLISRLAEHTLNLEADPRCGLLFDGTAGHPDRLTGPRLSIQGRARRDDDTRRIGRFLARHPSAAAYIGFADFGLWRVDVERGHMVAGFGRIRAMGADQLHLPPADWLELAPAEEDIVAHMNADHADALALYATRLLDLPAGDWRMTGIDPDGCDLRDGPQAARLPFATKVRNADQARAELVRLVKRARQ
ncbi:HugZ family protein [Niveispirillum irakense]|uniref:HugZ family pyridoxamine 5'-phosphate oxidase n=1 Tax=Niveispirillum irakense TaxID=34011 RepID=UPI00040535CE|nr:DUF2470 domain-containing protein [Niveispirillum irakense]